MTSTNVIGESEASDILSLYVAAVPSQPDPPTESIVWAIASTAEVGEELAVQVNWTAPADNGSPILGYRLYMAEEQSPSQILYDGSKSRRADVFSFTVRSGIQKHLSYQFRLQALNAVGLSTISEPLAVLAAVVPVAPTELNVTGSGQGSLDLEWTPPQETGGSVLTGYFLYYQKYTALLTAPEAWLKSSLISQAATTQTLVGLEADEQYRVKIVAVNVRGESPFSTSVTHFAGAVPSGLSPPTAVAGSRTLETIGIAWVAPATSTTDVLGYRLYVNEPTSNAVPTELVYDGGAIPNVYKAKVSGLQS